MNEERIEVIKYMHNNDEKVHEFDIDWLIEQTEKAERLEEEIMKFNRIIGNFAGEISNLADDQTDLVIETELRRIAKEMMFS